MLIVMQGFLSTDLCMLFKLLAASLQISRFLSSLIFTELMQFGEDNRLDPT